MRADIGEAYRRVMRKAWLPANGNTLNDQGRGLRPLTQHTASMYIRAMMREWRKLGTTCPLQPSCSSRFEFVPAYQGKWAQRRTRRNTIALTNWYALNHELSHWMFWRYANATRRSGNGQHHHCDRHLSGSEPERSVICGRMIEPKPFTL